MSDFKEMARTLDDAARFAKAIPQLSTTHSFDVADAYTIQSASIDLRLARGEKIVGLKMGFTSRAKAIQMGVDELIYGWLTDAMLVEDGGKIDLSNYVHPRVEPELAMRLDRPLEGKLGIADCYAAVSYVAPAMEIIDSRYKNFKFSLSDVVSDNSSSSGFVLGPWVDKPHDPSNLGMILSMSGKPVQIGSTAAVLGNPVRALAAATRMLAERDMRLEAGWIILTGGATAAEALQPEQHILNEVQSCGRVEFRTGALHDS